MSDRKKLPPGRRFLHRARVFPAHRRHGLQVRLIRACEIKARRLGLIRMVTIVRDHIFSAGCRYRNRALQAIPTISAVAADCDERSPPSRGSKVDGLAPRLSGGFAVLSFDPIVPPSPLAGRILHHGRHLADRCVPLEVEPKKTPASSFAAMRRSPKSRGRRSFSLSVLGLRWNGLGCGFPRQIDPLFHNRLTRVVAPATNQQNDAS